MLEVQNTEDYFLFMDRKLNDPLHLPLVPSRTQSNILIRSVCKRIVRSAKVQLRYFYFPLVILTACKIVVVITEIIIDELIIIADHFTSET